MGFFDSLFPKKKEHVNLEKYTDLEIVNGTIQEFPDMNTDRLPDEVKRVRLTRGGTLTRNGKSWMWTQDDIFDAFMPKDTEEK